MFPRPYSSGAGTAAAAGPIERRLHRRYPVQCGLRYKLSRQQKVVMQGLGKMLDISSGGIFFAPDQPLPNGFDVELSVDWPVRLEGGCPLQLRIAGRIVRSVGEGAGVKINRTEFRTRGTQAVPIGAASGPEGKIKTLSPLPSRNARTPAAAVDEAVVSRARSA